MKYFYRVVTMPFQMILAITHVFTFFITLISGIICFCSGKLFEALDDLCEYKPER